MTSLPSYIDPELWAAFVESRKAMKVPFTPLAQKLVIRKLMAFHADGWDANASLEKSAIYGYRGGLFKVKSQMNKHLLYEAAKRDWLKLHPNATPEQYQRAMKALARKFGL